MDKVFVLHNRKLTILVEHDQCNNALLAQSNSSNGSITQMKCTQKYIDYLDHDY